MRIIVLISLALAGVVSQPINAQEIPGCMDPLATNYNSAATVNNGSCVYNAASGSLSAKATLSETINEISGMIHINGKLYALNDGGNAANIYVLDTATGVISQTITLGGASNVDWEDLTSDGTYIYVGDFGNNTDGARTDLKFYRVPIQSLNNITGSTGTVPASDIETISFRYEDQPDPPSPVPANSTAFDCEAVVYSDGNLHLFTKNWVDYNTAHYIVSAEPGTHIATKEGSFNTGQILITGATKANDNIVILLGYSNQGLGDCAIWMLSGFTGMNELFATGNKRKIDLGSAATNGQVESITAVKQTRVLISNEYFFRNLPNPLPDVEVLPTLYGLNTDQWTAEYVLPLGISNFTAHISNHLVTLTWEYNETSVAYFDIEVTENNSGGIYQSIGKVQANARISLYRFADNSPLSGGKRFYRVKIVSSDGQQRYSKVAAVTDSSNAAIQLTAVPNPFSDKLAIRYFSDKRQTVHFSVMDTQGRTILLKQLQCMPGGNSLMLDGIQGLSQGIYILTARTNSHTYVCRLVK